MNNAKPTASRKARQRQTAWRAVILIFVLAGSAAGWYFFVGPGANRSQTPAATGPQTYTSPVIRGDLRVSAAGSGKLAAFQSVDLSFSTSGTVSMLYVKTGDFVKAGQPLASLGSSETLEANLAEARLKELQAEKTLDALRQNAGLALAQAYSNMAAAQKTYAAAEKTSLRMAYARCGEATATRLAASLERAAARLESIRAERAMSDTYITAKKAYDTALANYNQCTAYSSDEKASAAADLEVARTALQEAQDTYDTLRAASGIDPNALAMAEANRKMAQAQLAKAEEDLAGITLTAPMDGKITYLAASAGAKVGTETFITIVDTTRAALEISVEQSDMSKLVLGAPVTVTFDALPDRSFTGKVIQVNPEVTISGQYQVVKGRVELDEEAVKTLLALPLGLSASVTLNPQEALGTLLVPGIALHKQNDGSYAIMVVNSGGQAEMRPVTIGLRDSDYAEITSGLEEGEQVSTGTVQFVAAGSTTSSSALKNAQDAAGLLQGHPRHALMDAPRKKDRRLF